MSRSAEKSVLQKVVPACIDFASGKKSRTSPCRSASRFGTFRFCGVVSCLPEHRSLPRSDWSWIASRSSWGFTSGRLGTVGSDCLATVFDRTLAALLRQEIVKKSCSHADSVSGESDRGHSALGSAGRGSGCRGLRILREHGAWAIFEFKRVLVNRLVSGSAAFRLRSRFGF